MTTTLTTPGVPLVAPGITPFLGKRLGIQTLSVEWARNTAEERGTPIIAKLSTEARATLLGVITIRGAKAQNYPEQVYGALVLDDAGDRNAVSRIFSGSETRRLISRALQDGACHSLAVREQPTLSDLAGEKGLLARLRRKNTQPVVFLGGMCAAEISPEIEAALVELTRLTQVVAIGIPDHAALG